MFRFSTAALRFTSKHTLLRSLSFNNRPRRCDSGPKVLPPELSRNTVRLTCKSSAKGSKCDVYVVGTFHKSPKSCEEVKAIVNYLKPQVVFLELCSNRTNILDRDYPNKLKTGKLGRCRLFYLKIAKNLGAELENEFMVAYEEGIKYGAKIILGDRPIQITKRRFKEKLYKEVLEMPPWQSIRSALIQFVPLMLPKCLTKRTWNFWDVKKKDVDLKTVNLYNEYLKSLLPTAAEAFVDERDQYMSAMLLQAARKHNSVVAVVGKGHVTGIQNYWKQPVKVEQLLSVP